MRNVYLTSGDDHVSCTDAPFDPTADGFLYGFQSNPGYPASFTSKAQQVTLNIIRYEFDDSDTMFPILNLTLPASDLLQQLWMFRKIHVNRTAILDYTEKWFVSSLAMADDFHSCIRPLFGNPSTLSQEHSQLPSALGPCSWFCAPASCRIRKALLLQRWLHWNFETGN